MKNRIKPSRNAFASNGTNNPVSSIRPELEKLPDPTPDELAKAQEGTPKKITSIKKEATKAEVVKEENS